MSRETGIRRTAKGRTRDEKHVLELSIIERLENDAHGRRAVMMFRKLAKAVWKDISRLPHREPRVHIRDRRMVREILAACEERETAWSLEARP